MAERSLDHFFNVVCHESRWPDVHVHDRHDLLRQAIIHLVTTSRAIPRLRRAAQAWMPVTHTHRQFRRLMLAKDLQPIARDQLTEPVRVLMQNLEGWLRTNWYQKGEINRAGEQCKWPIKDRRKALAQKRAMNVEQRRLKHG